MKSVGQCAKERMGIDSNVAFHSDIYQEIQVYFPLK